MRNQHKRSTAPLTRVPTLRKGLPNRRVIARHKDEKREYYLHATKGYRSFVR